MDNSTAKGIDGEGETPTSSIDVMEEQLTEAIAFINTHLSQTS